MTDLPVTKLFITGHKGLAGSALCRKATSMGCYELIHATHAELDLSRQEAVEEFFLKQRPEIVIHAAAKVGGVMANKNYPADFIRENLKIQTNVIEAARLSGVQRFLFLASASMYPAICPQPIHESTLLTSHLDCSNEAYAIAKIAGVKMCQFYRQQYGLLYHSVIPTNLYGPCDNYHAENSHVIPALIRRFHEAKLRGDREISIWGSGTATREFLHCDDLAEACFHLLDLDNPPDWINVGSGEEVTIANLAQSVARAVGYQGQIVNDLTKPNGYSRKFLDTSAIFATGWKPQHTLQEGLKTAYGDFLSSLQDGTARVG